VAFLPFATMVGPACQKGWAEARVVPERVGRRALGHDGAGAGAGGPGVPVAADGSVMRRGGGLPTWGVVMAGTEAARAARREELLRGPTARQPNLCDRPAQPVWHAAQPL